MEITTSHNPLISFYYSVRENIFEITGREKKPSLTCPGLTSISTQIIKEF